MSFLGCRTDKGSSFEDRIDSVDTPYFSRDGLIVKEGPSGIELIQRSLADKPTIVTSNFLPPCKRVVLSSTTQLHYFKLLGQIDKVVGCPWIGHVMDQDVMGMHERAEIIDITKGAQLDLELILKCRPDVFLFDPRESVLAKRLESYGVVCIPFFEYLEKDPLIRLEWLDLIGLLTEQKKLSSQLISKITKQYEDIVESQKFDKEDRPTVILVSFYQGTWSAAGPSSLMAELIEDAGGEYILKGSESEGVTLQMEEIFRILPELDFLGVIDHGPMSRDAILNWDDRFSSEMLDSLHIFSVDTQVKDYFGRAIVEPHLLLSDVSAIIRHDRTGPFHYFFPVD